MEEATEKHENVSGYLSEDDKVPVVKINEKEDSDEQGALNKVVESPFHFIKQMIPFISKEVAELPKVELMGDKLRKKKDRTKRRTANSYKKDIVDRHDKEKYEIKRYMGSNRSIVRYIGSNAPITPQNRQYFELFDTSSKAFMSKASSFISTNFDQMRQHVDQVKYSVVPSLADLGQLVWDDFKFTEDYEEEDEEGEDENEEGDVDPDVGGITFSVERPSEDASTNEPSTSNENISSTSKEEDKGDTKKITDLQDELAKLRAQIAMIVAAQSAAPATPAPPPVLTPVAIVPPTMLPPPAPPPPPPPPVFSTSKIPTIPMKKKSEVERKVPQQGGMDDVLKGITSVRLKSTDIEKSPGGTPMRNRPLSDPTNPADIIAKALREKFQNSNMNYYSPEKGDSPQSGFTPSPPVKKTNQSTKVHPTVTRPVPKPRPRPRPRVQKKMPDTENAAVNGHTNFQSST